MIKNKYIITVKHPKKGRVELDGIYSSLMAAEDAARKINLANSEMEAKAEILVKHD